VVVARDPDCVRLCFYFARDIYNLLVWPYRLAAGVDTPIEMVYTAPRALFFTEMKLALFGLALPTVLLYELSTFAVKLTESSAPLLPVRIPL
jgi:Sec-independent protein secretion pathway component TatC